MHSPILRNQVRQLRAQGKTYAEIGHSLKIALPKSTLSSWCEDVALPSWYQEKVDTLNQRNLTKAQKYAWAQVKRKREIFLDAVKKEAEAVLRGFNVEACKVSLAMLYLGEGSKWQGHSGLMLGNADPNVILLYVALLEKCYNIKIEQLKCRIGYRADQNINELEKYWSSVTGIPRKNFYKTKPDPRTKGKKTKKPDYKGVCVISCAGAQIQLELEMITKFLLQNLRAHSSVVER